MSHTIQMPAPWYTPRPAPADLADDVVCSWEATVTGTHRLLPDGCVDILWLDTGLVWVCGPETQAWEFTLPAGVRGVGVRFRPGAVPRVLQTELHHLANSRARLGAIFGDRAERVLSEQLGEADDPLPVFESAVRRWLAGARPASPREQCVAGLATGGTPLAVAQIARETGLSSRQLHRQSLKLFGYSPTTLARIVRLQRFVLAAAQGRAPTVGQLSAAAGYYDQSHLWRDCRAVTGTAPTDLLASHGWTFPTLADPYLATPGTRSDVHHARPADHRLTGAHRPVTDAPARP